MPHTKTAKKHDALLAKFHSINDELVFKTWDQFSRRWSALHLKHTSGRFTLGQSLFLLGWPWWTVIDTVVFLPFVGWWCDGRPLFRMISRSLKEFLSHPIDDCGVTSFSNSCKLEKMGASGLSGFLNPLGSRGVTSRSRISDMQLSSFLDSRVHFSDVWELLYTPPLLLRVRGQNVRSFLSDVSSKGTFFLLCRCNGRDGKTSRYS